MGTLDSPREDGHIASAKPLSLVGLWDDEVIATARIPHEKVVIQQTMSRGGGGEVYLGLYNQQQVAIKMLLPEIRKSVKHVNAFLAEVKLMAALDHPRIVQLVGVAWDSLTDLCAVAEFMEGGDLRALLTSYEKENHVTGFDYTKVTIALHVAHALTYLHSLETPVLHRDLKSKNALLTSNLDAKLTDFGISREQVDKTMTAGVGMLLWMAPEVMLGERYDDKADMFSFGVLLSELDVHTLPYSHAKEDGESKIPETVVLQMVVLGKLRVDSHQTRCSPWWTWAWRVCHWTRRNDRLLPRRCIGCTRFYRRSYKLGDDHFDNILATTYFEVSLVDVIACR